MDVGAAMYTTCRKAARQTPIGAQETEGRDRYKIQDGLQSVLLGGCRRRCFAPNSSLSAKKQP